MKEGSLGEMATDMNVILSVVLDLCFREVERG